MTDYLDNDNQTSLLFKLFQNKVQTGIDTGSGATSYSAESKSALKFIYPNQILVDDICDNLSGNNYISNLQVTPSISGSIWDVSTNNVRKQILFPYEISGTNLVFYKDVYLQPVAGTNNAWWLIPDGSAININNNLLKNMIPYNFNKQTLSMFSPIVNYYNNSVWIPENQNQSNSLNWLIDYDSGILQFYQNDNILNSKNIDYTQFSNEEKRPRISFIKYNGKVGLNNLILNQNNISGGVNSSASSDFSGLRIGLFENSNNNYIIDNSNTGNDISSIYFNKDDFDISFSSAYISENKLERLFFKKPIKPTFLEADLSNILNLPVIILKWNNPLRRQAALPFGYYKDYIEGTNTTSNNRQIYKLPFHNQLHIEYFELSGNNQNDQLYNHNWKKIQNVINLNHHIQNTVQTSYLSVINSYNSLSGDLDICQNAPYKNIFSQDLSFNRQYRFRIYLDNSGVNKIYDQEFGTNNEVSWNYLYLPEGSSNFITVGDIGQATAPTSSSINFDNSNMTFTINFINSTGFADVSQIISFPINYSTFQIKYIFGIDLSVNIDPSNRQMPNERIENSYNLIDLSSNPGLSSSTNIQYSNLIMDISALPEYIYELSGLYGLLTNDTSKNYNTDFSYIFKSSIPSRTSSVTPTDYNSILTNVTELNNYNWDSINDVGTNLINTIPAIENSGSQLQQPVYLLTDLSDFDLYYNINNNIFRVSANNIGKNIHDNSYAFLGLDSSGYSLSKFILEISNIYVTNPIYPGISHETNPSIGYLQYTLMEMSNNDFHFIAESKEVGKSPHYQYKGYYTGIDISKIRLKNINLNRFPDTCNNNYDPYKIIVRQVVNDLSRQNNLPLDISNWQPVDGYYYQDFRTVKDISTVQYTVLPSSNPTTVIDNYMMGLARPDNNIPIPYGVSFDNINLDWINPNPSTSEFINPYKFVITKLLYENSYNHINDNEVDDNSESYPSNSFSLPLDFCNNLQIGTGNGTNGFNFFRKEGNTQSNFRYSRKYEYPGAKQFTITGEYRENLTIPITNTAKSFHVKDFNFGSGNIGKRLWWDYTWDNNNVTQATNKPHNFVNITGSYGSSSDVYFIKAVGFNNNYTGNTSTALVNTYDHTQDISHIQLMWANGSFRSVGSTNNYNYPYIDFSSQYYNPGGLLRDYSIYDSTGLSGEHISIDYDSQNSFKQWWDNTSLTFTSNVILKYITVVVKHPLITNPSTGQNYFNVTVKDENNNIVNHCDNSNNNGFWLFLNEHVTEIVNNTVTVDTTVGPKDGQTKFDTQNPAKRGCYSHTNQIGYIVRNATTSTEDVYLEISIGLPSTLNKNIGNITLEFFKV